jgi:hypothetical protein
MFRLDFREHANCDSRDRIGRVQTNVELSRPVLSFLSASRTSNAKPCVYSGHPPAPKHVVLVLKSPIDLPTHPWTASMATPTWPSCCPSTCRAAGSRFCPRDPLRVVSGSHSLRGVCQPTALPPPEIAIANPPATTPALQTSERLQASAEPGRGGHELIDADPLARWTRGPIKKAQPIRLSNDADGASGLAAKRSCLRIHARLEPAASAKRDRCSSCSRMSDPMSRCIDRFQIPNVPDGHGPEDVSAPQLSGLGPLLLTSKAT